MVCHHLATTSSCVTCFLLRFLVCYYFVLSDVTSKSSGSITLLILYFAVSDYKFTALRVYTRVTKLEDSVGEGAAACDQSTWLKLKRQTCSS